jgi:hypothetical protein
MTLTGSDSQIVLSDAETEEYELIKTNSKKIIANKIFFLITVFFS